MNGLVKITYNEDGQKEDHPKWHLVHTVAGTPTALCTGEVFGYAEGRAQFETKWAERGGITCPGCLKIIKFFKAVKL